MYIYIWSDRIESSNKYKMCYCIEYKEYSFLEQIHLSLLVKLLKVPLRLFGNAIVHLQ